MFFGKSTGFVHGVLRRAVLVVFLLAGLLILPPARPAQAYCVCDPSIPRACACIASIAEGVVNTYTTLSFKTLQEWMKANLFQAKLFPMMAQTATQVASTGMLQLQVIGGFLDAKHLLETQRLYQTLNFEAFKDYYPNEGLCTIGTVSRSVMAADAKSIATAAALRQYSLKRQLLNAGMNSTTSGNDRDARYRQFREKYCDRNDNNGGLGALCGSGSAGERRNKDIDYPRTFAGPLTLDIDFTDSTVTPAEEDIQALMANLYSPDIANSVPPSDLKSNDGKKLGYLDMRAIIAKRAVAEHSFQAIAAIKGHGVVSAADQTYLLELLKEMGMSERDASTYLGSNPSYLAQLDLVSRKLVQRPEFYVDLMDKPANVQRKAVAMDAMELMQKREIFNSAIRSESMLSILVEMGLVDIQPSINAAVENMAPN